MQLDLSREDNIRAGFELCQTGQRILRELAVGKDSGEVSGVINLANVPGHLLDVSAAVATRCNRAVE
jgi:hypothetical protein